MFVTVVGNTQALAQGVRFIEDDLNRIWSPERVDALRREDDPASLSPEEQEMREILFVLEEAAGRSPGSPDYLLDLHTTSAGGAPFATVGDTLRNRSFAYHFPATRILGLEEQLDGPLLEYMNNRGWITMGFEGGQHEDPAAVDNHESVLWLALVAAGLVDRIEVPRFKEHRRRLKKARRGNPRVFEVRHRHGIAPEDRFTMKPGFRNFQAVEKGDVLGEDRRGEVTAVESGRILMPLYQGQGADGFFLGRRVTPLWLRVSAFLRRARVWKLMPFLPGVWRHPDREATLIVNTRVARIYPLEIFHLLGYRKRRRMGPLLLVSRRAYDD